MAIAATITGILSACPNGIRKYNTNTATEVCRDERVREAEACWFEIGFNKIYGNIEGYLGGEGQEETGAHEEDVGEDERPGLLEKSGAEKD